MRILETATKRPLTVHFGRMLEGGDMVATIVSEAGDAAPIETTGNALAEQIRANVYEYAHAFSDPAPEPALEPTIATPGDPAKPMYSTFEAGGLVADESARARIESQHAVISAAGYGVGTDNGQFFANGTRMASGGYGVQYGRKAEHDRMSSVEDAANELRAMIQAERREDREVSARELGDALRANGRIQAFGLTMTEQSIRGLASRLESPMLGYALGVRDRIAAALCPVMGDDGKPLPPDPSLRALSESDRAMIANVLRYECLRLPDTRLKLRTRAGNGDVFAIVSPGYVPADAPEVLAKIVDELCLQAGARGEWSYDPVSTQWELRAQVWTPTPVEQQAVGEPFKGYVSFQSRDNGTSRFRGGGGIELLRCLNASTYLADGSTVNRVHRGGVMADIQTMLTSSMHAIETLCKAWGVARTAPVEVPRDATGGPVPLSEAIPGFWRYMLRDRSSELVGVLPGRADTHIKGLSAAYMSERRDPATVVRSDLANGWTRNL